MIFNFISNSNNIILLIIYIYIEIMEGVLNRQGGYRLGILR